MTFRSRCARFLFLTMTLGISMWLVVPLPVSAQELAEEGSVFTYGFELDLGSQYIWRGVESSDGPALNPYAWCSAFGFTLSGWVNMLVSDAGDDQIGEVPEVDIALEYEYGWNNVTLTPSLVYYYLPPEPEESTPEISLKVGYSLDQATLYTTQYFDMVAALYDGEIGVGYEHALNDAVSVSASAAIGWAAAAFNEAYFESAEGAVDRLTVGLNFSWTPLGYLYVTPYAGVDVLLASSVRNSAAVTNPEMFYGGVMVGVEL